MGDRHSPRLGTDPESEEKSTLLRDAVLGDGLPPVVPDYSAATAENLDIEKTYLSVLAEKIKSPNSTANKAGNDEFDWLGDDADLLEQTKGLYTGPPLSFDSKSSLYDNVQLAEKRSCRQKDLQEDEAGLPDDSQNEGNIVSRNILHIIFMLVQLSLVAVSALGFMGRDLGTVAGVQLHYWTLLFSMVIFLPLIQSWSIELILKRLRHMFALQHSELPNYIEASKYPLILFVTNLIVAQVWFKHFPVGCDTSQPLNNFDNQSGNPFDFCLYHHVDKLFYIFTVMAFLWEVEEILMFLTTTRFHERTFKARIIDCRFKIYIIQQIALKALASEANRLFEKTYDIDTSNRLGGSSGSVSGMGIHEPSPSFLGRTVGLVKRLFWSKKIINSGQHVMDTAANFVQIQMDDPDSRQVAPQTASQSFGRFSRTLGKHMQLYGFKQFEENKSCLSSIEAKLLARDLFSFLLKDHKREYLVVEDFAQCFETNSAALDAHNIFEEDNDGKVTKREFRNEVVSIYKELSDLTKSIRASSTILKKLDIILKLGLLCFLIFIALSIFSINVTNMLTLSLSIVIGLNFIFGDTAKHVFTSIVMLFINHPFDIGDTIVVGLFEEGIFLKEIVTVKQINLLSTVFTRWNGQETYIPNHMLAAAPFLTNLSRSVEQWEKIDFKVPSTTSSAHLSRLRQLVGDFLKKNHKFYFTVFDMHAVVAADLGHADKDLESLEFSLRVKCKVTSDAQKRWERHAKLIKFIKVLLEKENRELG